jgi:hypothetical protein
MEAKPVWLLRVIAFALLYVQATGKGTSCEYYSPAPTPRFTQNPETTSPDKSVTYAPRFGDLTW